MLTFRIAARSVFRNHRRTLVTIGAMGFAGFIMVFYSTLLDGYMKAMLDNALGVELGEIQIHSKGWDKDPDLYKQVSKPAEVMAKLESAGFNAAPRVYGFALAAAGSASAGIQIRGVDVQRESEVTKIHKHVAQGEWVDPSDPYGVVVGRKLARSLSVNIGDEVVLVGQGADGSMANELYKVRGVLKTTSDAIDRAGFFMNVAAARELLVLSDAVHELAIVQTQASLPVAVAAEKVAEIAPDDVTKSWRQLQPMLARLIDMGDVGKYVMLFITYTAVAMIVLNATLMSVFERIREFGVLKALGVGPAQVGAVVLFESLIQVALASVLALGTGIPTSLYFQEHGIDLSNVAGVSSFAGMTMDPIWYSQVTLRSAVEPVVTLVVVVLLAAAYPGLKAALIRPIQAIHHR